jgi:diguanylate cyclase (GGDEF)-like protein/PAS domain S-box-containing protein
VAEDIGVETQTAALAALEIVPFAMVIADGNGDVRAVNRRWSDLSGLDRAASLGSGWLSVVDPDARPRLQENVARVAGEGQPLTADHQLFGPHGSRWARWWISRHDLNGTPLIAIAVADVHEDYARQANLYHLATHDSLTGLINRSHFVEQIEQALRRNQRQSRHVGVVYVDLDDFKTVNDQGGHALGDRVLFAIGARLRHTVRAADVVARIGGDEFAVLCEGLGAAEQAEAVAGRIAAALSEAVELEGVRWPVAASVGAAVDRGSPDSAEELIDRADRAMYSVKLTRRPPAGSLAGQISPVTQRERAEPDAGYQRGGPAATPMETAQRGVSTPDVTVEAAHPGVSTPDAPIEPAQRGVSTPDATVEAAQPGVSTPDATVEAAQSNVSAPPAHPSSESGPASGGEVRSRLLEDVVTLRESLDSIRRMLDRLLSPEGGVIDIRERQEARNRD